MSVFFFCVFFFVANEMFHFWVYLLNLWIESVSDIIHHRKWPNTYLWLGRSKELLSLSSLFLQSDAMNYAKKGNKNTLFRAIPESKCIESFTGITTGDLWDQPRELQSHHIILGRCKPARTLARCTMASRCRFSRWLFLEKDVNINLKQL